MHIQLHKMTGMKKETRQDSLNGTMYNTVKCNGLHALTMNNIIKAFINLGKRYNLCKKKKC